MLGERTIIGVQIGSAESILEVGQQAPIMVRQDGERFMLVEGLHRLEACKDAGRENNHRSSDRKCGKYPGGRPTSPDYGPAGRRAIYARGRTASTRSLQGCWAREQS